MPGDLTFGAALHLLPQKMHLERGVFSEKKLSHLDVQEHAESQAEDVERGDDLGQDVVHMPGVKDAGPAHAYKLTLCLQYGPSCQEALLWQMNRKWYLREF